MSTTPITAQIPSTAAATINVALVEPNASTIVWSVLLEAEVAPGEWVAIGNKFSTTPPAGARDGARLIAQATYLGALAYRATATPGSSYTGTPSLVLTGSNPGEIDAPIVVWDNVTPAPPGGGGGGGGGTVPVTPGLLVVDAATATPTPGQTGSWGQPFATIAQAIAAAVAGTLIYVLPGTYAESIVPPDLDGLAIEGSSRGQVIVQPASGPGLRWIPALVAGQAVKTFSVRHVTLVGSSGNAALSVDASAINTGAGASTAFCSKGFTIEDCYLSSGTTAAALSYVGLFTLRNVLGDNAAITVNNCLAGSFDTVNSPLGFAVSYSTSGSVPPGTQGNTTFLPGCTGGALSINTTPHVVIEAGSQFSQLTIEGGSSASSGLVFTAYGSAISGAGGTNIGLADPASIAPIVTFDGMLFVASFGAGKLGGSARQGITCRNCTFTGVSVAAQNLIDLDVRGCVYEESTLSVSGSGTIDRDRATVKARTPNTGGDAVTLAVPFPASVGAAQLLVSGTTQGSVVGVNFGFTALSATGFTATASAAESGATADYAIERVS